MFLACTIATHPKQVAHYIGTTEAGTVWLAYPGQDPEEVAEAFRRRGSFAPDVMTELAGLRFNGIQLDATVDEFIENRRLRAARFAIPTSAEVERWRRAREGLDFSAPTSRSLPLEVTDVLITRTTHSTGRTVHVLAARTTNWPAAAKAAGDS